LWLFLSAKLFGSFPRSTENSSHASFSTNCVKELKFEAFKNKEYEGHYCTDIDLNKCNPELCGEGQLCEQIKAYNLN
jgi:hypothetical protein